MNHSQQFSLARRLLTQLGRGGLTWQDCKSRRAALSSLALIQLGRLGLKPPPLLKPGYVEALADLAADDWEADQTEFADRMTPIARLPLFRLDLLKGAVSMLKNDWHNCRQYDELFADPCLLGWLYQVMLKESAGELRATGKVALASVTEATQWFTPPWIAEFLAQETIEDGAFKSSRKFSFIDPACGAGHILVPAVDRLFDLASVQTQSAEERLTLSLKSIIGLDIDPLMIELSAFALYLQARRQFRLESDLPVPHLYAWGTADGIDAIGSLRLGVPELLNEGALYSPLKNRSIPLSSIPREYDSLATNPPYLGHRLMPAEISTCLKQHFPSSQYDLYAAFLTLATKLVKDNAIFGMICQQSFLSIQRYERLRNELAESCALQAVAQLGSGVFAAKAGEKANNAIVVLRKGKRSRADVRCWRLLTPTEKSLAEETGLGGMAPHIVPSKQLQRSMLGNGPMPLWCPAEIYSLFDSCAPMENESSGIVCSNGLFTCDNKMFLKKHNEVSAEEQDLFVPYDKGGGHKWYRTTQYMLRWENNGDEIRKFRKNRGQSAALPGEEFYFCDGVTYSYIGTRGFKARLLTPGSIFDIASSAVFSTDLDHLYLLGFLNSSLVCFLLGVLNPTINFQIGDMRKIPFITPAAEAVGKVVGLSRLAVELAKEVETFDPSSPMYVPAADSRTLAQEHERRTGLIDKINAEERSIQTEIDSVIFDLYQLSEASRLLILSDPWVLRSRQPLAKAVSFEKFAEQNRCVAAT